MDIHIIVKILLEFCDDQTIKSWSRTRILNKEIKEIVDNQKYEKGIWGRSTFISTNTCNICDKRSDGKKVNMLVYIADNLERRRIITHCKHWLCHLSAILSMIQHYKENNIYLLKKKSIKNKEIIIPRSDGSETTGFCKTNYLHKKNEKWYVYTYWYASEKYMKLVPLKYYTQKKPEIIFEN